MRLPLYLISSLILINSLYPYKIIDPKTEPLYKEIMKQVQQNCTNKQYFDPIQQSISIEEIDRDVVAVCYHNYFTRFRIVYNKRYWDSQTTDQHFSTLTHEITHCLFDEPHKNDLNHYMYAYENDLDKTVVIKQFDDYLKGKCKNAI